MSNKKNKERWQRIQNNKKKCCRNCSQLQRGTDGNYFCGFLKYKGEYAGAFVWIGVDELDRVRGICFDKYNGLNLK